MKLKSFSQTLGLALLTVMSITANESAQIYLSAAEVQEIYNNPTRSYVYVGRDASNLVDVIAEINKLENEENSPAKELEDHINKGFVIGDYDGVAQALEHAEAVLNRVDVNRTSELSQALNAIIEQVDAEQLNIDAAMLEDANIEGPITRACGSCNSHCLRKLVIKEKVDFLNKVKFRDDVTFYDDVKFKDDVLFEDDVIIEGTLSVTNLVVLSCMDSLCVNTLSATDAIITNATIENLSVTDLVVLSCMDSLCVGTLSVSDIVVAGGSCLDLCFNSLSVTDAFIQNLSVTNLSVVEATVTGTLSVNDQVINGDLTIPSFTPAGVIHNNGAGLLSSSLIVNADITNSTISNAKLATISSADINGNIVVRDGSGNFATNMITLNGTVTNPTDAATKAYVDATTAAITGANVGVGTGLIFRNKTGSTLNFRSLIQSNHIVITNNANDITIATDATTASIPSTIVLRDASGRFEHEMVMLNSKGNMGNGEWMGAAGVSSDIFESQFVVTRDCTITSLYVESKNTPTGGSFVFTIYVDGVAQPLVATIVDPATTANTTGANIPVLAGQKISLLTTLNATTAPGLASYELFY